MKKTTESETPAVSVSEFHALLGGQSIISIGAVYRAIQSGHIPSLRVGGRILISRKWLLAKLNGAAR